MQLCTFKFVFICVLACVYVPGLLCISIPVYLYESMYTHIICNCVLACLNTPVYKYACMMKGWGMTNDIELGGQLLFTGGNQYDRIMVVFHKVIAENE